MLWANGAQLDNRYEVLRPDFQALAAANDLAVVAAGGRWQQMKTGEGSRILDGLRYLGERSGHPELEHAAFFVMGHSNGGFMASSVNDWLPSRVGGFVGSHGVAGAVLSQGVAREALANPGVLTAGEVDRKVAPEAIESAFVWLRLAGAHLCLAVEQGEGHPASAGSMALFLLTMQHLSERRLTATGTGGLSAVDESQAWLADNATWKDGITQIMPAASAGVLQGMPQTGLKLNLINGHIDFKSMPQVARMSWLLDKDIAYIYRGLATYSNPLRVSRADGHGPAYLPREPVVLEGTAFGEAEWKSIGVYDGAIRVGEIGKRNPRLVLPRRQKPGAHAGVLVGELPDGALRTSQPISWVIWP